MPSCCERRGRTPICTASGRPPQAPSATPLSAPDPAPAERVRAGRWAAAALAVAMLLAFAVPRTAAAQVGTTTDIITGTVTGRDSQPLAGAIVQATSLETQVSRQRTTDARGRFTIVFPEGGGQYQLTVRYVGLAPARVTIARQADEDRLVANVQMDLAIVTLEPVAVQAAQPRGLERLGPGATGRDLRSERSEEHTSELQSPCNL